MSTREWGRLYQVYQGRRPTVVVRSVSALEAVKDVMIRQGAHHDDVNNLGPSTLGWRGATYRAEEIDAG